MLTASRSEGMGDTETILRVLDPAAEEAEIEKVLEVGNVARLQARMEANAARYLKQTNEDVLLDCDDLQGTSGGD